MHSSSSLQLYLNLPIFHHSGRWAGYLSDMLYFPKQHFAVVVLANNSSIIPIARDKFAGQKSSVKLCFSRGSDGKVTELRFSMLDAWNVRFTRIGNNEPF